MRKLFRELRDRLFQQKYTTIIGTLIIVVGLFDPEPYTKFGLISLGVGLIAGKDTYFSNSLKNFQRREDRDTNQKS